MNPNEPHRLLDDKDVASTTWGRSTLCAAKLGTVNVENIGIGIGGIINVGGIGGVYYATTLGETILNVRRPFFMQWWSARNLDWGLCEIGIPELIRPNMHDGFELLGYMDGRGAQDFDGPVRVFFKDGKTHPGHFNSGYDVVPNGPNQVKRHGILLDLMENIEIRTGVWVVKNNLLCGYVVHTYYVAGAGRVCHMLPIWHALQEVEAKTEQKVFFGQELHDMMKGE